MPNVLAASIALLLLASSAAGLPPTDGELSRASDGTSGEPGEWSAWGGHLDIEWNRELLRDLGMQLSAPRARTGEWLNHQRFAIGAATALRFAVRSRAFDGFEGGALQVRGGYVLSTPGGDIALHDFILRPRSGNRFVLDLVTGDGKAWFYVDRLMYDVGSREPTLSIQAMDLRIAPALALRLGKPWAAGQVVAGMEMEAIIQRGFEAAAVQPEGSCPSSSKWPGMPAPGGEFYGADVFMQNFSVSYSRRSADADGPGGSDGSVVFTPSSTLRNNRNGGTVLATIPGDPLGTSSVLHAADVAWHTKFSGNCDPYGNDQHPYLIWNLYRIDALGRIEQVGRSGVKHAFLTVNSSCDEHPGSGHILGRGCADTYGVGNNDSGNDLGPRSEILPATGQWGRCGSIYDANCDGSSGDFAGYSSFTHRLQVRESTIDPVANAGASWLFESWYIVRDDVDIYNTMQTRPLSFAWTGSSWSPSNGNPLLLGPAIDRWVDPVAPGDNASSGKLELGGGHARVAMRATDVGGGNWRYDYAVMNFDFAIAETAGSEPNLRVLSNAGFEGFRVPLPDGVAIQDASFADGDADPGNDWILDQQVDALEWNAPEAGDTLDWGTLFRFSFVANVPPMDGQVVLHPAGGTLPPQSVGALLPAGDPPTGPFTVGGVLSGLAADAAVEVTLNGSEPLQLAGDGPYAFSSALFTGEGYAVVVTGQPQGQDCSVANGSGTIAHAPIEDIDVTCTDLPDFAVAGTATGLSGPARLQLGTDERIIVPGNGPFAFATLLPDGSSYTVHLHTPPAGQECTLANASGTIDRAPADDLVLACTTIEAGDGLLFENGFEGTGAGAR